MKTLELNATKEDILSMTKDGILFYMLVIPDLQIDRKGNHCKPVLSPFYEDTKPGFNIYYKYNRWRFKDFGAPEYAGDVIDFAAYHYKLDRYKNYQLILNKIEEDIDKGSTVLSKVNIPAVPEEVGETEFTLSERKCDQWTSEELSYWATYGITTKTLNEHRVVAIDSYSQRQPDDYTYIKQKPSGQLWFSYKREKYAKIYCPSPKKFWFIGNSPKEYVFGETCDYYPEPELVFLTAGEKDALCLLSRGYNAMCLNSETSIPSQRLVREWFYSNKKICVLYDLDSTGMRMTEKLCDLYGFSKAGLPQWVLLKGGKDVSDFFKMGGNIEELLEGLDLEVAIVTTAEKDLKDKREPIRTAQQRLEDAVNLPEIKMFFDVFLHSGELAILFGDTGIGKSILAVAIADAVSRGESLMGLQNQHDPCNVIYYDFELSDKQFQKRYSNEAGVLHHFDARLYTDNIDLSELEYDRKNKFEQVLMNKIRDHVIAVGAKLIIIDNVTFLTSQTAQDAQPAMVLMKILKEMKHDLDITIIVLAHTPKRSPSSGLTINDLAGSKHLSNFADSVFAISTCASDPGCRYIKQVKPSRSGELKFDQSNVLKCELTKDDTFLTFQFIEFCEEMDLLVGKDDELEEEMQQQAYELKTGGMTIRDIAKELGVSKSKVGRWLVKK